MSSAWIMTLAAVAVGVCAILAAYGFRGRITTVGIDLGTTFSVIGVNDNGKVIIIPDKQGRVIFPSIVTYLDDGSLLTAYEARAQLATQPLHTIFNAKRFIGHRTRRSSDEEGHEESEDGEGGAASNSENAAFAQYVDAHPFRVVPLNHSQSNYSDVGFQIPSSTGVSRVMSPEQVGADVLRHLLDVAAQYLGHSQVNKAVIAVPAKFDANQRAATGDAFKRAGLKVVRVIEEPTAAAVAYQLHKQANVHHVLVYDFGGGTLDVSLLYIAKGSVQVYATDGDDTLGGSDLDNCLAAQLHRMAQRQIFDAQRKLLPPSQEDGDEDQQLHQIVFESEETSASTSEVPRCSMAYFRETAENMKKALSSSETASSSCLFHKQNHPEEDPLRIDLVVQRDEHFLQGCAPLFERALLPVERLLRHLEMSPSDVDEIVLVGGSTRIPHIKYLLRTFFQRERLHDEIDPDVTVAYGAASILQ